MEFYCYKSSPSVIAMACDRILSSGTEIGVNPEVADMVSVETDILLYM